MWATRVGLGTVGAVLVAATAAPPAALAGDSEALFGPKYRSISVTKDGEPRDLVPGTKLRVSFARYEGGNHVTWDSGCNAYGAEFELSDSAITIDRANLATYVECLGGRARQDAFLAKFFEADPAWSIKGRRLTLSTDRVVIKLRAGRKSGQVIESRGA